MSDKRKQTPDVLADILGGAPPTPGDEIPAFPAPPPAKPKPAARPKTTRAPRRPSPAAPADWQYQVVSFQDYKGWRARFVDGKELRQWPNSPLVHEYLAQMAGQGWELVTASSGERLYGLSDKHQLYFRRPK
jgi:hypothetical protein